MLSESYKLPIYSNKAGTEVCIKDRMGKDIYKGATPDTVTLERGSGYFRKSEYFVHLSKEGFEEQIIPVYHKINRYYYTNIPFLNLLGLLIIDPVSGAMWSPTINEIKVEMIKKN
jgi:hypothetical protein